MPVMLVATEILGHERDKYLLLSSSELRAGATQQPARAKSTPRARAMSATGRLRYKTALRSFFALHRERRIKVAPRLHIFNVAVLLADGGVFL